MAKHDENRIPAHPLIGNEHLGEAPRRAILMTPLMSTVGALLVFFIVAVIVVVILPTFTMSPSASDNWIPLSDEALAGRQIYTANGCVYCHSGFARPQDHFVGAYYLYPRVAEPGDYWEGAASPNLLGTARTGPDLSNEGGQHPGGWHDAHYFSARAVNPISIMPRFSFLSADEHQQLVAFNQSSGGKDALLRHSAVSIGHALMATNMTDTTVEEQFPELVENLRDQGTFVEDGKPMDSSPWGLPWKPVWHINSFERGYWQTNNPLPVTQQSLMRGKTVFLERCVGCHGNTGDGQGAGAQFLTPGPFNFAGRQMSGIGDSPGMYYHRILTAGPGTAMENFGTRLSVEDIWRVVMFLRTIPNGSLETKDTVPTVDLWEPWEPNPPLRQYIDAHPAGDVVGIQDATEDPFMAAARWIAPGLAPDDEVLFLGQLPITLERLESMVHRRYEEDLQKAFDEAVTRGNPLPPRQQIFSTQGLVFNAP